MLSRGDVRMYMKHVCRNWSVTIGLIGSQPLPGQSDVYSSVGKKGVASQFMSAL